MEPIKIIDSRTVVLPYSDIDTDQIMPARFLKTTTREGLGEQLFADWRYQADGTPKSDFVLNSTAAEACEILVAGRNFGCGSSREHAPWGLLDYGFKAIVSSEFADIFRNNSLKNGLLPVEVDAGTSTWLLEHPGARVVIDLESSTLTLPTGASVEFPIEPFARYCLLHGTDQIGYLLNNEDAIERFERAHA